MQRSKSAIRNPAAVLAVDRANVLDALGERALDSSWQIDGLWSTPETEANPLGEDWHTSESPSLAAPSRKPQIPSTRSSTANSLRSSPVKTRPWVIVEAVDSSYYTVRSKEPAVLWSIRDRFRNVSDY